jgi:hypothetical protein
MLNVALSTTAPLNPNPNHRLGEDDGGGKRLISELEKQFGKRIQFVVIRMWLDPLRWDVQAQEGYQCYTYCSVLLLRQD